LSDVAALLWLGICLPELFAARQWRTFGQRELLREMDKQVLADGAHYEFSTGYQRYVTELFLWTFVLCRSNGIQIEQKYWSRLRTMLEYIRNYLRPDGSAPQVGDSDGGRFLPLLPRDADDHAYIVSIGAALFDEPTFKICPKAPEELEWMLGPGGTSRYCALPSNEIVCAAPQVAKDAATAVLRGPGMYLLITASAAGLRGRGAHGHNDALSVEVAVEGSPFIVDPASYVYTGDLRQRNLFRSTAYHSTVEVDGLEQNTIEQHTPFLRGDEARPRFLQWQTGPERDVVSAEHYGYTRLRAPVMHRRTITLDKTRRYWLIEDRLSGRGTHELRFRFHCSPAMRCEVRDDGIVEVCDGAGRRLLIAARGIPVRAKVEEQFSSRNYGSKEPSLSACWQTGAAMPYVATFILIPVKPGEDESVRLLAAQKGHP
jgi:hypothetical protein